MSEERRGQRKTDGGTYLIVADDTDETKIALKYAIDIIRSHNAHLAIAHVIDTKGYATWGGVENMMRKELREEAEKLVWEIAKNANEEANLYPSLYLREGDVHSELMDIINEPQNMIRGMILCSSSKGDGPGPLVSYFTSKIVSKVNVPLTIVPGHLDKIKEDNKRQDRG